MSTVATRQQKTSEPTRQQKIAALEKELSDLLEEDIEKANERLRKASIEVAKIKRKLERAEQERAEARALLAHLREKERSAGAPPVPINPKPVTIYTCSRHPLSSHPHNYSTSRGECPNCECYYDIRG